MTAVPLSYCAVQTLPQSILVSALATLPEPVPSTTVKPYCGGGAGPKVAVTDLLAFMVTLHEVAPVQAPLQPLNTWPASGVAAKLTVVPDENVFEQVAPQLIPAGTLVTVPVPVPDFATVSVYRGEKTAVTAVSVLTVNLHCPVPAQAELLQPVKT